MCKTHTIAPTPSSPAALCIFRNIYVRRIEEEELDGGGREKDGDRESTGYVLLRGEWTPWMVASWKMHKTTHRGRDKESTTDRPTVTPVHPLIPGVQYTAKP